MRSRGLRQGFTLIELLVVIAIIAVLIGLLMPAVQRVRETASRIKCANNLRQIGIGCHTYHDANGHLPSGYMASGPYVDGTTDTAPGWSWAAQILPYIEQDPLYRSIRFDLAVDDPQNAAAAQTIIPIYLCPSDLPPGGAFTVSDAFGTNLALAAPSSYAASVGGDESDTRDASGAGVFYRNSRIRLTDIKDGTSDTIMVCERAWCNVNGIWAGAIPGGVVRRGLRNPNPGSGEAFYPAPTLVLVHCHLNNAATDFDGGLDDPSSNHIGGSNFVFADASVHFIRSIAGDTAIGYTADSIAFQALGTRGNDDISQGLDY